MSHRSLFFGAGPQDSIYIRREPSFLFQCISITIQQAYQSISFGWEGKGRYGSFR